MSYESLYILLQARQRIVWVQFPEERKGVKQLLKNKMLKVSESGLFYTLTSKGRYTLSQMRIHS